MSLENKSKQSQKSPLYRFSIKILTQQLTFGILGFLLVTLFLAFFSEETATIGTIIASSLALLLSLSGIFVSAWHIGDRDRNLVNYNHISYQKYKSLLAALLSLIPAVLLAIPVILYEVGVPVSFWFGVIYKIFFAPYLWLFLLVAEKFPPIYLAPVFFIPPMCVWGYRNGFRSIYLMPKVMFRKKRS